MKTMESFDTRIARIGRQLGDRANRLASHYVEGGEGEACCEAAAEAFDRGDLDGGIDCLAHAYSRRAARAVEVVLDRAYAVRAVIERMARAA